MSRNIIETVMGAVVLVVAGLFLAFAYKSASISTVAGYDLMGKFSQAGGLQVGGDVRISGVKVGTITSLGLDPVSYLAEVHMSIDPTVKLPVDTIAVISSESLLGGKYMALQPGGDSELFKAGDTFEYTQSAPDLESLIGQAIFSQKSGGTAPAASEPAPTAAP